MNNTQKYNYGEKIIIYLLSSLVGVILTLLTMLLTSLILVLFEIPLHFLSVIASICLIVGSFFAGLISSKKIGSGGIVNGIIVAFIIFLLIFLTSLILDPAGLTLRTLIHFIISILSSLIGGIIGVNNSAKFL